MEDGSHLIRKTFAQIHHTLKSQQKGYVEELRVQLEKVTDAFKDEYVRSCVSDEDVQVLSDTSAVALSVMRSVDNITRDKYDFVAQHYRCLRNMCANCQANQDKINQHPAIMNCTKEILEILLSKDAGELEKELHTIVLRCIIQFIGNCIAGHHKNKTYVWQNSWQEIFRKCIENEDSKLMNYTCMVIHNCLTSPDASEETSLNTHIKLTEELAVAIIQTLVHQEEFEFGLFVIEDCLTLPGFMEAIIGKLSGEERLLVLEVLINQLKNIPSSEAQTQTGRVAPSVSYLSHIAAHVKSESLCILSVLKQEENIDPQIVVKELEALGLASSLHTLYKELQDDGDLLTSCIYLLSSIEKLGNLSDNAFSSVDKVTDAEKVDEHHPAYGLKRDLIRIIGNMCHRHKPNQDKVRELDGIPLILNQTNIDGRNPFITQWAVLAIYNLLEENEENQAAVADLKLQGFGDNSAILEERGLEVQMRDGKVYVKSTKRKNKEN